MRQNVGTVDRILRILMGLMLISFALAGPHTPWGWLGLYPLTTGIFGYCSIYNFFSGDTLDRPKKSENSESFESQSKKAS